MGRTEKYSQSYVDFLISQGHDPNEAVRIASTSMDGAHETPSRGLWARQTACHELGYDEALPGSEGAVEGKRFTLGGLRRLFGRGGSESDLDKEVDRWIKDHS